MRQLGWGVRRARALRRIRGWVEAQKLAVGDEILNADGSSGVVEAVIVLPVPQVMYTLSVQHVATYLVGMMERLMNPPITRRIYRAELALITAQVAG